MLVFRDAAQRRTTSALLEELSQLWMRVRSGRRHDDAIEMLIVAGQLECAVLDALQPEEERLGGERSVLDALSRTVGRWVAWSWSGRGPASPSDDIDTAIERVRTLPLPPTVEVKTPEGFAWYAVHPEAWFEAGRTAVGSDEAPVVVVGLRSIGTALSAMVTAAVPHPHVERIVVRPRGHPYGRSPRLSPQLREALHGLRHSRFLIVDEGPGLSGSSLTGVAEAIARLGVPDERIILLPAWDPDPSRFVSEVARASWPRWRKIVVSPESIGLVDRVLEERRDVRDWSAGVWRSDLLPWDRWPPVQPQHERRKWRSRHHVIRFVGLARPGRDTVARIERMHAAGLGPALTSVRHGHAALRFVEGRVGEPPDPDFVPALVRYLEWLRSERVDARIDFDGLREMIEVNVGESLGIALPALERFRRIVEDGEPVRIDGRMHPHEWVRTEAGWTKLDGFDHHADHFYPGTQDVAWDLAGIAAEHSRALRDEVLSRLGGAQVPAERLAFYDLAYGAFRVGYAQLAAEATRGEEQDRWRRERTRCERFLRDSLARIS